MKISIYIFLLLALPLLIGCEEHESYDRTAFFPTKEETPITIPHKQNVWVFILAGQSNMAGRAFVGPQDTIPNDRILTINSKNQLIYAKEPLHFYEPDLAGLDCGLSFGYSLLKTIPENITVLLLPTAVGGSSIAQWINDSFHRNVKLYANFKDKITLGQEYGIIKGILWHHGENDATSNETIKVYKEQLKILFDLFRKDADDLNLPILIGELGSFFIADTNVHAINRQIQEYVKTDNSAFLIKTDDLKDNGDKIHFDSEGQREMGKRFAYKFNYVHNINRLQIKCAVANSASRNIPLRLGFRLEGIERAGELLTGGIFTDLAVYSRLKGDG